MSSEIVLHTFLIQTLSQFLIKLRCNLSMAVSYFACCACAVQEDIRLATPSPCQRSVATPVTTYHEGLAFPGSISAGGFTPAFADFLC